MFCLKIYVRDKGIRKKGGVHARENFQEFNARRRFQEIGDRNCQTG